MNKEDKIKNIQEHPDQHRHTYTQLIACCTIDGVIDLSVLDAHQQYVDLGSNGGIKCDTTEGPCACGAWH